MTRHFLTSQNVLTFFTAIFLGLKEPQNVLHMDHIILVVHTSPKASEFYHRAFWTKISINKDF